MTWQARVLVPSLEFSREPSVRRCFYVEADSFLDAVFEAEGVREEDEVLVSLSMSTPNGRLDP